MSWYRNRGSCSRPLMPGVLIIIKVRNQGRLPGETEREEKLAAASPDYIIAGLRETWCSLCRTSAAISESLIVTSNALLNAPEMQAHTSFLAVTSRHAKTHHTLVAARIIPASTESTALPVTFCRNNRTKWRCLLLLSSHYKPQAIYNELLIHAV